jgi:hypothetical protein
MANPHEHLLTAIDVGSAKTCALVAEITDNGLRYRGHGVAESRGSRKGVIVELDKAVAVDRAPFPEAVGLNLHAIAGVIVIPAIALASVWRAALLIEIGADFLAVAPIGAVSIFQSCFDGNRNPPVLGPI